MTVLDVSVGGLAIESSQKLMPGRTYTVVLPMGEDSATTTGSVVWCRLLGTQRVNDDVVPIFRTGLRFDAELDGEVMAFIDSDAGHRSNAGTRLQARFRTSELPSAMLGGDTPFEVESISKFGMAVIMEFCPSVRSVVDFVLSIDDAEIEIRGRVADVVERGDQPGETSNTAHFVVGIEFGDLAAPAETALAAYLADGWGEASKAS
ncbi:MAG: PilZ domain-containing protein [Acidobacteriota bacterium]|nr:PilZ domain-containing protein [Acidobacteriota bacterium]